MSLNISLIEASCAYYKNNEDKDDGIVKVKIKETLVIDGKNTQTSESIVEVKLLLERCEEAIPGAPLNNIEKILGIVDAICTGLKQGQQDKNKAVEESSRRKRLFTHLLNNVPYFDSLLDVTGISKKLGSDTLVREKFKPLIERAEKLLTRVQTAQENLSGAVFR